MSQLRLTRPQILKLNELLLAAFPARPDFDMLLGRLNQSFAQLGHDGQAYRAQLFYVLTDANAQLWLHDLLFEASNAVPSDPDLKAALRDWEYLPGTFSISAAESRSIHGPQLELKIRDASSTFDIVTWRTRLAEIEGRVCRVEYPEKESRGTGFLVGCNTVITNYHVVQQIREGTVAPSAVRLRFDYKVMDGIEVQKGIVYKLAENWLIDWSPYSVLDSQVLPHSDPSPDELDYAILSVDGTPGMDRVAGLTAAPGGVQRRWIEVPSGAHDFQEQPALYIVEHPDGKPMQVAIDSQAIVGVNGNGTRVRYTTPTECGSSGSPCFGPDWQWIALHHSGDPKYYVGQKPEYNEGIPVSAICALLRQRGKLSVFGGGC